jgi:outer membrane protease
MKLRVGALLVVLALPLAAEGPSIEAGVGLEGGQAYELVLRDGTYSYPISRLTWDIPASLLAEMTVKLPWNGWTATALTASASLPLATGTMVDEDWDALIAVGQVLNYGRSEHTAILQSSFSGQLEQTLGSPSLSVAFGGAVRYLAWGGYNGSGQYLINNYWPRYVRFIGPVITYEQLWFAPYVGLMTQADEGLLRLETAVRFAPYSWGVDKDFHIGLGDHYVDEFRGGLCGAVSAAAMVALDSHWLLGLRLRAEGSYGAIGAEYMNGFLADSTGAGGWYWQASVSTFVRMVL